MNQDLLRLKYLRDRVIDIEMNLTLIDNELLLVEKDLIFLETLYVDLRENMMILKADGIVVLAAEYKRTIKDLESTIKKISIYENKYNSLLRSFDQFKKLREEALEDYEMFKKHVESTQSVLKFDPSRKKK